MSSSDECELRKNVLKTKSFKKIFILVGLFGLMGSDAAWSGAVHDGLQRIEGILQSANPDDVKNLNLVTEVAHHLLPSATGAVSSNEFMLTLFFRSVGEGSSSFREFLGRDRDATQNSPMASRSG